jgi:plastocyanin
LTVFRHRALRLTAIVALAVGVAFATHGCGNDNPTSPGGGGGGGADVTISIVGIATGFSPNPDTVTVGQTVAWKNNDSVPHTSTADGGTWNTGNLAASATSAAIAMNTAGSFPYHCTIHPSMTATLVVKP